MIQHGINVAASPQSVQRHFLRQPRKIAISDGISPLHVKVSCISHNKLSRKSGSYYMQFHGHVIPMTSHGSDRPPVCVGASGTMAGKGHDSFDAKDYLRTRFGDVSVRDRVQFPLIKLHELFQSFSSDGAAAGPKVLEFGSGPVIQHGISVAAFASEIVFSDISSANRGAIQKWLDGDADAFNWSPHFDYVVKTLEGKSEKEAREREQRMRKISKFVFCDALSETPMEKGYEGPHVLLEMQCLDAVCADKMDFRKCMRTLQSLLKPGGMFVHVSTNAVSETANQVVWSVGGKEYKCIRLTHEFVTSVLKESGFREVNVTWVPLDPHTTGHFHELVKKTANGYHFITAAKV